MLIFICKLKFFILENESHFYEYDKNSNLLKHNLEKEFLKKELPTDISRRSKNILKNKISLKMNKKEKKKNSQLEYDEEKRLQDNKNNDNNNNFSKFKLTKLIKKNSIINYKKYETVNNQNNKIKKDKYDDNMIKSENSEQHIEEDDGIFFKKRLRELNDITKTNEKKKQLLCSKKSFNQNTNKNKKFKFKKKDIYYNETGKIKNKWYSKMTEDEYDDYILKAKSEHSQKLTLINKKTAKPLDLETFIKSKSINKEFVKKYDNDNKNKMDNNQIDNLDLSVCKNIKKYRSQKIFQINEKRSQNIQDTDINNIYTFTSNKFFVEKNDEDKKISFTSISKIDSSKIGSIRNIVFNQEDTVNINTNLDEKIVHSSQKLETMENGQNGILKDNKNRNVSKSNEKNKSKVKFKDPIKNFKKPLHLIKFDEIKKNSSISDIKNNKKNNLKDTIILNNKNHENIINIIDNQQIRNEEHIDKGTLLKHKSKKEYFENVKKFKKLKNISNMVFRVKSNYMRNIKIDFIIDQQIEKEKKEKLINKYLEEENKILESNNIENENTFKDVNFKIEDNNKSILKFIKYKDIPKIDSSIIRNTIYEKKNNEINFLHDSYNIPNLRNRLYKYPDNYEVFLLEENYIDRPNRFKLLIDKQIFQRESDQNKKLQKLILENLDFKKNVSIDCESNFIKSLRNCKNDLSKENYLKFKNINYEYLNCFKFKYNRKKYFTFPNKNIKDIIENVYQVSNFEKQELLLLNEMKNFSGIKSISEEIILSNNDFNQREEKLNKYLNKYEINLLNN